MNGLDRIISYQSGIQLEQKFHDFIEECVKIFDVDAIVILFDDVDMSLNKAHELLETIRRLLSCPKILPVVCGDYELFDSILQDHFHRAGNKKWEIRRPIPKPQSKKLTEEYLLKVFPSHLRISLLPLNLLINDISIRTNNNDDNTKYSVNDCLNDIKKAICPLINGEENSYLYPEPTTPRELIQTIKLLKSSLAIPENKDEKLTEDKKKTKILLWNDYATLCEARDFPVGQLVAESEQSLAIIRENQDEKTPVHPLLELSLFNVLRQAELKNISREYNYCTKLRGALSEIKTKEEEEKSWIKAQHIFIEHFKNGNRLIVKSMPPVEFFINGLSISINQLEATWKKLYVSELLEDKIIKEGFKKIKLDVSELLEEKITKEELDKIKLDILELLEEKLTKEELSKIEVDISKLLKEELTKEKLSKIEVDISELLEEKLTKEELNKIVLTPKNLNNSKLMLALYTHYNYYSNANRKTTQLFFGKAFELLSEGLLLGGKTNSKRNEYWVKAIEDILYRSPFHSVYSLNPTKSLDSGNGENEYDIFLNIFRCDENVPLDQGSYRSDEVDTPLELFAEKITKWENEWSPTLNEAQELGLSHLLSIVMNKVFSQLHEMRVGGVFKDDTLPYSTKRFEYVVVNAFASFLKPDKVVKQNVATTQKHENLMDKNYAKWDASINQNIIEFIGDKKNPNQNDKLVHRLLRAIWNHPIFDLIENPMIFILGDYKKKSKDRDDIQEFMKRLSTKMVKLKEPKVKGLAPEINEMKEVTAQNREAYQYIEKGKRKLIKLKTDKIKELTLIQVKDLLNELQYDVEKISIQYNKRFTVIEYLMKGPGSDKYKALLNRKEELEWIK